MKNIWKWMVVMTIGIIGMACSDDDSNNGEDAITRARGEIAQIEASYGTLGTVEEVQTQVCATKWVLKTMIEFDVEGGEVCAFYGKYDVPAPGFVAYDWQFYPDGRYEKIYASGVQVPGMPRIENAYTWSYDETSRELLIHTKATEVENKDEYEYTTHYRLLALSGSNLLVSYKSDERYFQELYIAE